MSFTHLRLRTEYSFLDSTIRMSEVAKIIKSLGMSSIAITDPSNLFGAIDFYKTMKKYGIKPIIGVELIVTKDNELEDSWTSICAYAKNKAGYQNLMKLSSLGYLKSEQSSPKISKKILDEHSEGLICISSCLQQEAYWHLDAFVKNMKELNTTYYDLIKEEANWYKKTFKEDFYLEIMRHGIKEQEDINSMLVRIAEELSINLVATNDVCYAVKKDAKAHEVAMCIKTGSRLDYDNRPKLSANEFYIKSPKEMKKIFTDIPKAISSTQEIVNKCSLEIDLNSHIVLNFKFIKKEADRLNISLPSGSEFSDENDNALIAQLCKNKLKKRLKLIDKSLHKRYEEQLQYEIGAISKARFSGSILTLWDILREAKRKDIPVGAGRGFLPGSLVAYVLKITTIDPIKYRLVFERFLNPEKIQTPYISIDFCQSRRGEIFEYIIEKYGNDRAAHIVSFVSMLAKTAVRNVSRALDPKYSKVDKIVQLIPSRIGLKLSDAYKEEPKLAKFIESDKFVKKTWEYSLFFEDLKMSSGAHPGGIVISNKPLWQKTPLYRPPGATNMITQYGYKTLSTVGLVTFNFLSLKTLTIIHNTIRLIKIQTGKQVGFEDIIMDDSEVFKTIASGNGRGLFMVEDKKIQKIIARMKPSNFENLVAILALARQYFMEPRMVDSFIRKKYNKEPIQYILPELEPILASTYGEIIFIEQGIHILHKIGGFSLASAELACRILDKMRPEETKRIREEFIRGAIKKDFDVEKSKELFEAMLSSVGFWLDKSHLVGYTKLTYQTAWLKTYYPDQFFATNQSLYMQFKLQ